MTNEQEKQWREEFESDLQEQGWRQHNFQRYSDGNKEYYFESTQSKWSGYLAAKQSSQLIIDAKDKELAEVRAKLVTLEQNAQDEIARLNAQILDRDNKLEAAEAELHSMNLNFSGMLEDRNKYKSKNAELRKQLEAKQAHIDQLMLEYCPDDMTQEQVAEWEKHQQLCSPEMEQIINQALSAAPKGD